MAGKPKPMSQIKQLIILNRQGKGTKTIARLLGMSKNTVKTYLFKLDKLLAGTGTAGITAEKLLSLGEPEIYALFHPGNPSYKDPRYDSFKAGLEHNARKWEGKGSPKPFYGKNTGSPTRTDTATPSSATTWNSNSRQRESLPWSSTTGPRRNSILIL